MNKINKILLIIISIILFSSLYLENSFGAYSQTEQKSENSTSSSDSGPILNEQKATALKNGESNVQYGDNNPVKQIVSTAEQEATTAKEKAVSAQKNVDNLTSQLETLKTEADNLEKIAQQKEKNLGTDNEEAQKAREAADAAAEKYEDQSETSTFGFGEPTIADKLEEAKEKSTAANTELEAANTNLQDTKQACAAEAPNQYKAYQETEETNKEIESKIKEFKNKKEELEKKLKETSDPETIANINTEIQNLNNNIGTLDSVQQDLNKGEIKGDTAKNELNDTIVEIDRKAKEDEINANDSLTDQEKEKANAENNLAATKKTSSYKTETEKLESLESQKTSLEKELAEAKKSGDTSKTASIQEDLDSVNSQISESEQKLNDMTDIYKNQIEEIEAAQKKAQEKEDAKTAAENAAAEAARKAACDENKNCLTESSFMMNTTDTFGLGNSAKTNGGTTSDPTAKQGINNLLGTIIQKLMIALGTIALLIMAVGAGYIILYHGQDEYLSKGKGIFIAGLTSLVVALSSYLLVNLLRFILYSTTGSGS